MTKEQNMAQQMERLLQQGDRPSVLDDRTDAARLDELRRLFVQLHPQVHEKYFVEDDDGSSTTAQAKWKQYLQARHVQFRRQLQHRIQQGKRTAVRTFWGVVASSPIAVRPTSTTTSTARVKRLDDNLLQEWIEAMTHLPLWDQSIQHMVQYEFIQPFYDVQYYTMVHVRTVAHQLYNSHHNQEPGDDQKRSKGGMTTTKAPMSSSALALASERLFQLLTLIPLVASQDDLDNPQSNGNNSSTKSSFLFAPLTDATLSNEDEDSDSSSDNDDDSSSDDEDDTPSQVENDEEDEEQEPPSKVTKSTPKRWPMQSLQYHRRQWCKAWLAVLRLPWLPVSCLKQALLFLPQHVLPVVHQPLVFTDFFMQAYSTNATTTTTTTQDKEVDDDDSQTITTNSMIPILALDGLFYLMTQHGLEYPSYYSQLYQLIRPTLFTVKYRNRFFQLLDKSISRNDLLPAYVVAAMGKRLLRSALSSAPPAGILVALAMVSNWFRKHPETQCLLHRTDSSLDDAYNATTDDPAKANALQSSLWELSALSTHYYPAVATMAASLGTAEELALPLHNVDDFLDLSYKSLIEQERKQKRKQQPNSNKRKRSSTTPLAFTPPNEGLFSSTDVFAGILKLPKDVSSTTTSREESKSLKKT